MASVRECHADDQLSRWYGVGGRRETDVYSVALAQLIYDIRRTTKENERKAARKQNLGLALTVLAVVALLILHGT